MKREDWLWFKYDMAAAEATALQRLVRHAEIRVVTAMAQLKEHLKAEYPRKTHSTPQRDSSGSGP